MAGNEVGYSTGILCLLRGQNLLDPRDREVVDLPIGLTEKPHYLLEQLYKRRPSDIKFARDEVLRRGCHVVVLQRRGVREGSIEDFENLGDGRPRGMVTLLPYLKVDGDIRPCRTAVA